MLITSFGDGTASKLEAVKQLPFEVTVNRVVTQAPAKQLPDRANAGRAVRCKQIDHKDESTKRSGTTRQLRSLKKSGHCRHVTKELLEIQFLLTRSLFAKLLRVGGFRAFL